MRPGNSATTDTGVHTALQQQAALAASAAPPVQAPVSKVPLKPASDVLAGALARAASQSTIHPLDTLKVRLQTAKRTASASSQAAAFSAASKHTVPGPAVLGSRTSGNAVRVDLAAALAGVGSLYKGLVGAASGAGIAIGAYFALYGLACNTLSRHTDLSPSAVAFVGGGAAALGSSVVKVPLAVCIRSVQAGVYPNVFNAAKSIVQAAGPRGLFTGFAPTVLEDVPDMAIKFAVYEAMRQVHSAMRGGVKPSLQEDFMMGAIAGALAAASTTPLDVIKTNMMCNAAARPSMGSAAGMVLAQGGPAGFFRGIGTRALSNGINSAVFFCFFETIRGAMAAKVKAEEAAAACPATRRSAQVMAPLAAAPQTSRLEQAYSSQMVLASAAAQQLRQ